MAARGGKSRDVCLPHHLAGRMLCDLSVSAFVERKPGGGIGEHWGKKKPTSCREGVIRATILYHVLEDAVSDGDSAAATVGVGPIVATQLAGGRERVILLWVGLRSRAGQLGVYIFFCGDADGEYSRQAPAAGPGCRLGHRPDPTLEDCFRDCGAEGSVTGPQCWDCEFQRDGSVFQCGG